MQFEYINTKIFICKCKQCKASKAKRKNKKNKKRIKRMFNRIRRKGKNQL